MNISHREYSTGFFFGRGPIDPAKGSSIDKSTDEGYLQHYLFCGFIGEQIKEGVYALELRNQIREEQTLEYIGSDILYLEDSGFTLLDDNFEKVAQADHGKIQYLATDKPLKKGYIIRRLSMVK